MAKALRPSQSGRSQRPDADGRARFLCGNARRQAVSIKMPEISEASSMGDYSSGKIGWNSPVEPGSQAEKAFFRASGSYLVPGNTLRLLKNAKENFPAWLSALESARHNICFESYIFHNDETGREFAEVLERKAREGVRVRVVYDWLGSRIKSSRRFWQKLRNAGVQVRCYSPPRWDNPFFWLKRDHRKAITVDGQIGFVSGLCVSRRWRGDPARGIDPWRDTGVEVRGPAVAHIEAAFEGIWAETGRSAPEGNPAVRQDAAQSGSVSVRVIAGSPGTAGLYRLDHLVATLAEKRLWLTDAYFVGVTPYVQALGAAARDGVDVRLLLPGSSDLPVLSAFSRAGYQPLLEAGIRVFEWNGPMLHAKTAVADGKWSRIGSTNLNVSGWIGNYELDIEVENGQFAHEMEAMYLEDLENSTEIVLEKGRGEIPVSRKRDRASHRKLRGGGKLRRAGMASIGIRAAVGAAVSRRRFLGPEEARILLRAGGVFLLFSAVCFIWPRWITIPAGLLAAWVGGSFLIRSHRLRVKKKRDLESSP